MLKLLIRTDASFIIGSGHVMRCLTLAQQFKAQGHQIKFWTKPLEGNMDAFIEKQGFDITHEVEFVDIIIVDHYQLDMTFEQSIRKYTKKIIVIDDLANRKHDCDLLLDQNIIENYQTRYDKLVPQHCVKLLGPAYLIMRDEFIEIRKQVKTRTSAVENLLIFMGGSDPTLETTKILKAIQQLAYRFKEVNVVVGESNINKEEIKALCKAMNINYHCQINYLAKLMNKADFALGAGGIAMWERCYVGLPSSSTIVASNQMATTELADKLGAIINLGWHETVTISTYINLLNSLSALTTKRIEMGQKGLELTTNQSEKHALINEMVGLIL